MDATREAASNLRSIRALMERATVYRAISAPAALGAGLLALVAALFMALRPHMAAFTFYLTWSVVFVLSAALNIWFLARGARARKEPFISPAMKLALRALLPPLLSGAVFTAAWMFAGAPVDLLVMLWILFYGLSLLSTQTFAPGSIVLLGWLFLLSALAVLAVRVGTATQNMPTWLLLGLTFGVYHLIYAALTWPRGNPAESEA